MTEQEIKHWVRLTRSCNNKCLFCLDYQAQDKSVLDCADIFKEIEKGYDKNFKNKQRLILSGGEPTIHPDFIKIIKFGKDTGFTNVQTITNGRMFCYQNLINQAKDAGLDEITFSLHGHNHKLHDSLTGINGSFKQALAGLKNALIIDFIVNIDIVVNKKNYRQLLEIIKFFHSLGVTEFDLLTLMPYGRAWDLNFDQLFYDLNDFQPVFEKILDYGQKNDLVIWFNRFPVNYFENKEYLLRDVENKLYHEIFGERKREFEKFLNTGQVMSCFDIKRCQYCFIKDFCAQLFYFNNLVKNKILEEKLNHLPFCLNKENGKKFNFNYLLTKGELNLDKFFKFYLKNLNQYKSLRCNDCMYNLRCRGLNYNEIKNKGFKILQPVK